MFSQARTCHGKNDGTENHRLTYASCGDRHGQRNLQESRRHLVPTEGSRGRWQAIHHKLCHITTMAKFNRLCCVLSLMFTYVRSFCSVCLGRVVTMENQFPCHHLYVRMRSAFEIQLAHTLNEPVNLAVQFPF